MNIINSFVHSELFFYVLIILFVVVLAIFGVVVYIECRKLKIIEAQQDIERLKKKENAPIEMESPKKEEPIEPNVQQQINSQIEDDEIEILEEKPKEQEENLENTSSLEIERLLARMQEDLEEEKEKTPECFEKEQEEQAIISYEELVRAARNQENMDVDSQTPISNKELEKQMEKMKKKEQEEFTKKEGFHTSQFISPVYGIQKEKKAMPNLKQELTQFQKEFQLDINSANHENMQDFSMLEEITQENEDNDVNKNVEFLDSLKEFRKNLE